MIIDDDNIYHTVIKQDISQSGKISQLGFSSLFGFGLDLNHANPFWDSDPEPFHYADI